MTNVTYDGIENIPNKLLRNFALMLGWKTPNIINKRDFLDNNFRDLKSQVSEKTKKTKKRKLKKRKSSSKNKKSKKR